MSVVVYKDGILAADSRAYGGKYQTSPGAKAKMRRLSDGSRVGVTTAILGMGERFFAWMEAGADPKEWGPDPRPDLRAIIVRPDGAVFLAEDVYFSGPIETTCYAIGSGADFALGAMACGATAEEAVRVACRFDDHCGEPVHVLGKEA